MSEEEKKAMETTKILIEFSGDNYIPKQNREKLQILLNLIEKQQKEIEDLKIKTKVLTAYHCDDLPTDVKMIILSKTDFERNINNDYICKDKIRKKIKELEKEGFKSIAISEKINILKELLEE